MRYAILEHSRNLERHWDLLFESPNEAGLRGWALSRFPLHAGWQPVRELEPHRSVYLRYEGPVLGAGGYVRRVDEGAHEMLLDRRDEATFLLRGKRHWGILELEQDRIGEGWYARFELRRY